MGSSELDWLEILSPRAQCAPSSLEEAPSSSSSYRPDAVQNAAILKNPQQLVICGDLVEIGSFLICEE